MACSFLDVDLVGAFCFGSAASQGRGFSRPPVSGGGFQPPITFRTTTVTGRAQAGLLAVLAPATLQDGTGTVTAQPQNAIVMAPSVGTDAETAPATLTAFAEGGTGANGGALLITTEGNNDGVGGALYMRPQAYGSITVGQDDTQTTTVASKGWVDDDAIGQPALVLAAGQPYSTTEAGYFGSATSFSRGGILGPIGRLFNATGGPIIQLDASHSGTWIVPHTNVFPVTSQVFTFRLPPMQEGSTGDRFTFLPGAYTFNFIFNSTDTPDDGITHYINIQGALGVPILGRVIGKVVGGNNQLTTEPFPVGGSPTPTPTQRMNLKYDKNNGTYGDTLTIRAVNVSNNPENVTWTYFLDLQTSDNSTCCVYSIV